MLVVILNWALECKILVNYYLFWELGPIIAGYLVLGVGIIILSLSVIWALNNWCSAILFALRDAQHPIANILRSNYCCCKLFAQQIIKQPSLISNPIFSCAAANI